MPEYPTQQTMKRESLQSLIDRRTVSREIVDLLLTQLVDRLLIIEQTGFPHSQLTAESVKIVNGCRVELDEIFRKKDLQALGVDIVEAYSKVLKKTLTGLPTRMPNVEKLIARCENHEFQDMSALQLELERESSRRIYIGLIVLLMVLGAMLFMLGGV